MSLYGWVTQLGFTLTCNYRQMSSSTSTSVATEPLAYANDPTGRRIEISQVEMTDTTIDGKQSVYYNTHSHFTTPVELHFDAFNRSPV